MVTYKDHNWTLKRRFIDKCVLIFTKGDEHFLFYNQNKKEEVGEKLIEFENYLGRLLVSEGEEVVGGEGRKVSNTENMLVFALLLLSIMLLVLVL